MDRLTRVKHTIWLEHKLWLKWKNDEEELAEGLRKALVNSAVYPKRMLSQIEYSDQEDYERVAIHDMVDRLSREDLEAVYHIAHLLLVSSHLVEKTVMHSKILFDLVVEKLNQIKAEKESNGQAGIAN